uniref:Uncharacterized protein n=1 Tax=Chaetoceros debilis TaxID=122233 RepID=A0A7S3Q5I0_9STRA
MRIYTTKGKKCVELGRRLWKKTNAGPNTNQDFNEKKVYNVGVTYHRNFKCLIDAKLCFVNHDNIDVKILKSVDHGFDLSTDTKHHLLNKVLGVLDRTKLTREVIDIDDSDSEREVQSISTVLKRSKLTNKRWKKNHAKGMKTMGTYFKKKW